MILIPVESAARIANIERGTNDFLTETRNIIRNHHGHASIGVYNKPFDQLAHDATVAIFTEKFKQHITPTDVAIYENMISARCHGSIATSKGNYIIEFVQVGDNDDELDAPINEGENLYIIAQLKMLCFAYEKMIIVRHNRHAQTWSIIDYDFNSIREILPKIEGFYQHYLNKKNIGYFTNFATPEEAAIVDKIEKHREEIEALQHKIYEINNGAEDMKKDYYFYDFSGRVYKRTINNENLGG